MSSAAAGRIAKRAASLDKVDGKVTGAAQPPPPANPFKRGGHYRAPTTRPLRVFAFDPTTGRTLTNHMTLEIPFEELLPGPIGRKIAVIDYDASNKLWYEPVDLDHKLVSLNGGLAPSESDPRFHQQMVYAVASETIRRFEFALGREITWRPKSGTRRDVPFRSHLRIFPHAFQQANAVFDPELNALAFGYFSADAHEAGPNLPNQVVFTCLSHDVVAHETTHAVIHAIRECFSEPTSLDTPAFHEAFSDIVALFQHFSVREALSETIRRTGGELYRELGPEGQFTDRQAPAVISAELTQANPLVGLAQQFGQALGLRGALRQALGSPADPSLLEKTQEPHARGAILVAAVFDAFFSMYVRRTRPLMRIARAGGAISGSGDLHPDLVDMLAAKAAKIAERFLNMCIRAIDYCPPVDIQFGEFLRALITADTVLIPEDPHGYRAALIDGFRRRGIVPEGVRSYSEEALLWCGPADRGRPLPPIRGLNYGELSETNARVGRPEPKNPSKAEPELPSDADKQKAQAKNAVLLNAYAKRHAVELGLVADRFGKVIVQAKSFHPVSRIGPDGRLLVEFFVEFLQQVEEPFDPNHLKSPTFRLRGGSTVIFSRSGEVRYVIEKPLDSPERIERLRAFLTEASASSAFTGPARNGPNFAAIHRGC